jgi:hypothetical protein
MTNRSVLLLCALPVLASAQGHDMAMHDKLGTVHFATSCAPAVAPTFDHAVALLHSFEFSQAIRGFNDVLAKDPSCAMADWGIALARWGNPMNASQRANAQLEAGRQAATAAVRLAANATPREQGYAAAVSKLYADYESAPQRKRVVDYETAMDSVATRNISDTEATIFFAISLVAAAEPTDKTYANQLRAGSMLEGLWTKQPDHPGLAHYIIHAYDVPALAPQAKRAAERYSEIAPSAAHALHMPSHTFTRVGMWDESVRTNQRSVEAAKLDSNLGEMLHASDYMVYAYLQMRRDSAAKRVMDGLPDLLKAYDLNASNGAANAATGAYALAAIPARYALERRMWHEAEMLNVRPNANAQTEAITNFARALGAAHTGDLSRARVALEALAHNQERLQTAKEPYWAEQVGIQIVEARAAVDFAEHRNADAINELKEAVTREDATEKAAVTPGPIAPAHELFGDMLLDMRRPADALSEYRECLKKEPNRFRSLYGAWKAAGASGDKAAAAEYAKQIEKLTGTTAYLK